ncbi:transglycosylase SLT domain-containing protein [Ideonella sp. 4Y11]|uniref:Transglycosylase SLT domain-containing protein n=1 Tax=Ideonella aquatica TaxID=2824119 RepID=A0A941BJC8_9BURK|nr:transglycosylase SLT domain-containing protein [Ideonella aquatica]MBQ0958738.1 transglycosylase SLT domain-containing protein [Ideonella aquatica]
MTLHQLFPSLLGCCIALLAAGCATPSAGLTGPVVRPVSAAPEPAPRLTLQPPGSAMVLDASPANPPSVPPAAAESSPVRAAEAPATGPIVDPVHPDRVVDMDDSAARSDLWSRVRKGFAMPELSDDWVRRAEQHYGGKPDYMRRMTERGGRYLFHIVEEVERRGMPSELALLPFVESAFNPQALSTARASGMWQFMPMTGKDYALKQNIFRDDRRDVLASTRAALDYLGRLNNMFGDWHLALAAYNWGEGNVQRAIARNQKAGLPTDYSSLRMPDETRYYVPKLQAIKNLIAAPENYGLALPELKNHPYFVSVPIQRDIDVDLAARLAGISVEEFRQLNPQMNKPVILAAGTEQVLLPFDNAGRFVGNLKAHHGPLASWTAWVAPKTLRPADAARQVGMSESELRDINRIPPRMLVKAGSTLLVPRTAGRNADVSEHLADNATIALAPDLPPMRRLTLRAGKRGDSVAAVAKRYRTSPAMVAQWNKVSTNAVFKPGSSYIVMVPQATKRAAPGARQKAPANTRRPTAPNRTRR